MSLRDRLSNRGSDRGPDRGPDEVEDLRVRVAELERQVTECQSLHHRFAELVDVVTELLVPLSARDQDEVDRILRRYVDELGS